MAVHAQELVVRRKGATKVDDVWSAAELNNLELVRFSRCSCFCFCFLQQHRYVHNVVIEVLIDSRMDLFRTSSPDMYQVSITLASVHNAFGVLLLRVGEYVLLVFDVDVIAALRGVKRE